MVFYSFQLQETRHLAQDSRWKGHCQHSPPPWRWGKYGAASEGRPSGCCIATQGLARSPLGTRCALPGGEAKVGGGLTGDSRAGFWGHAGKLLADRLFLSLALGHE